MLAHSTSARAIVQILAGLLLSVLVGSAAAASYTVTVDTQSLNGSVGSLDINFNPGPLSFQPASVQISDFFGGVPLAPPDTFGVVEGALPAGVTFGNASAFNDYLEPILYGVSLNFTLDLEGPAVLAPDGLSQSGSTFSLSLFSDPTGSSPVLTNDVDGRAFTADINLDGSVTATKFSSQLVYSYLAPVPSIPEPSTFLLLSVSMAFFAASRKLII